MIDIQNRLTDGSVGYANLLSDQPSSPFIPDLWSQLDDQPININQHSPEKANRPLFNFASRIKPSKHNSDAFNLSQFDLDNFKQRSTNQIHSFAIGRTMSREEALVALSEKTSYPIMQENGQRRYGPPPDWSGPQPPRGCEVFIGKIPRDCFEDELVPIFELAGRIYMFRLMMDFSGCNRGYGFCVYTNRDDTRRAVAELDRFEIRRGKFLGVCLSVDNCRLFVGGIPKTKTRDEIWHEMLKVTDGVKDVIVYPSVGDKSKNRGFAFVEYENHKAAAMARRKLIPGRIQLWGFQIAVDWAEPEREVDDTVMSKVRILYVRNLMLTTTEEALKELFNFAVGALDAVERVKKIRDYAFVHFNDRMQAIRAMRILDGSIVEGSRIEVTWAKPASKSETAIRLMRSSSSSSTNPPQRALLSALTSLTRGPALIGIGQPGHILATGVEPAAFRPVTSSHVFLSQPLTNCTAPALLVNGQQSMVKTNPLQSGSLINSSQANRQQLETISNQILASRPGQLLTSLQIPAPSHLVNSRRLDSGLLVGRQNSLLAAAQKSINVQNSYESSCIGAQTNNPSTTPFTNPSYFLTSPTDYGPVKLLIELCTTNGLGMPIFDVGQCAGDQLSNEWTCTAYTAEVRIPAINRRFVLPKALPQLQEATQSVAKIALQWLLTSLKLVNKSSISIQGIGPTSLSTMSSTLNCPTSAMTVATTSVNHQHQLIHPTITALSNIDPMNDSFKHYSSVGSSQFVSLHEPGQSATSDKHYQLQTGLGQVVSSNALAEDLGDKSADLVDGLMRCNPDHVLHRHTGKPITTISSTPVATTASTFKMNCSAVTTETTNDSRGLWQERTALSSGQDFANKTQVDDDNEPIDSAKEAYAQFYFLTNNSKSLNDEDCIIDFPSGQSDERVHPIDQFEAKDFDYDNTGSFNTLIGQSSERHPTISCSK